MSNIEEIFEKLFSDQVYLPFNKQILMFKIERYLANNDYCTDLFFDVFLFQNYEDLVEWCDKTNRTIQYLN